MKYEDDEFLEVILDRIEIALTMAGALLGLIAAMLTLFILGYLSFYWSSWFYIPFLIFFAFCYSLGLIIIKKSQR